MFGREMIVKKILFTVLCLCAVFLLMPVTAEANQIVTETEVSYPDTAERDEILKYIGTDSGWKDIRGNFKSVSVNAKNYLPMEKSAESDGNIGYSMVLRVTMDNGKFYAFRIINDTGVKYVYNRFGANGATTGWDGWSLVDTKDSAATELINGKGAEFKVERTAADILTVTINGTVFDTYTMDGVTAANKVVSVGFKQYGNPFSNDYTVRVSCIATYAPPEIINIRMEDMTNGKVTTDKTDYIVGETVKLIVTPDSGYAYKTLTVNGTNVIPDINGEYSFVAQESTYIVDGSFIKAVFEENTNDNWNLVYQGVGDLVMSEHTSGNSGWLKPLNNVSDITTTVQDYNPTAQDFSMIYKFTFKNAETIGLRLNGTDTDGKYRIQVMNGSTLSKQWANHYTLTSEQATNLKEKGIKFRTAIEGSNAVVYLDGMKVCTIDLSKVVATGNASYIKNMPVRAELRMDGNLNKTVRIPYEMRNSILPITINVSDVSNGKISADKTTCEGGETVKLTVAPDSGYAYKTLTINGTNVTPDVNGEYSFVAQESTYTVDGSFIKAVFEENTNDNWNLVCQGVGELVMSAHTSGNSGWLKPLNNVSDITTTVQDYNPTAQDFSMIYKFTFENGETIGLRLNGTDTDGKYKIQVMNGSTLSKQWANHYTLTSEQIDKVKNSGIKFRTAIEGLKAVVYLDGTRVCEIDLSKVVSTGNASYIINIPVRVEFRMDGNLNKTVKIPYELAYNISWTGYQFDTDEIEQYVIVYDDSNPDYATYAKQLADRIKEKYGKTLKITPDTTASVSNCEILLGDANRSDYQGKIMEYSVTVKDGKFRINVGGSCSAEKAIEYLCNNVFDGQKRTLNNGEYYHASLLTKNSSVTSGTTARVMSANVLADSFSGGSHKNANYRAEIFAGALISYTPDALGLQETDANWNNVLDSYLVKIEKLYGIKYSRCLATYEGKLNYTSLLYRSDKFKVENSGVQVFSWWKDKNFNHNYHMRNITWAQFTSLTDPNKKFVLANTHWSYRTEHANGNTYLAGSSTPIATNELRTQCMNETNAFMTGLKEKYSTMPVFLVGDFNTSLPFFTSYGWTPKSFNVISEQAKNNGTALSTVPTSNHFDHIFGTGNYTVKRYEFFNNVNQHSALSDHPFVYADLAF